MAECFLLMFNTPKRVSIVFKAGFDKNTKNPAIIVGHPMGAVKEQSAMYATKMAERGFVTLSLDPFYITAIATKLFLESPASKSKFVLKSASSIMQRQILALREEFWRNLTMDEICSTFNF
jgi:dienelactone hydrolase